MVKIRGWAINITNTTELNPANAPILIKWAQPKQANLRHCPIARAMGRNVQVLVVDHPGKNSGDSNIKNGTDYQRPEYSDRHVACRIFGLLCSGGQGIKPM